MTMPRETILFWVLAAALVAVGLAFILAPLLRRRDAEDTGGKARRPLALLLTALVPAAAIGLYVFLSRMEPPRPAAEPVPGASAEATPAVSPSEATVAAPLPGAPGDVRTAAVFLRRQQRQQHDRLHGGAGALAHRHLGLHRAPRALRRMRGQGHLPQSRLACRQARPGGRRSALGGRCGRCDTRQHDQQHCAQGAPQARQRHTRRARGCGPGSFFKHWNHQAPIFKALPACAAIRRRERAKTHPRTHPPSLPFGSNALHARQKPPSRN